MTGDIKKKIIWLSKAKEDLKQIIHYIKQDSPQNAAKVKAEVLQKITDLLTYPERYSPDKYKLLNANSKFRAFELHKIRVSYYINTNEIMIIRIRHVKQEPLFY